LWFDRNGGLAADGSFVDQSKIEQTKQRIRSLVAEIAQFSRSNLTEQEFYGEFLVRVVAALAAHGGAVWTLTPGGRLALRSQVNVRGTGLSENPERQGQHDRLLRKIVDGNTDVLVMPHATFSDVYLVPDETNAANPTDSLLLFGLLKVHRQTVGLVEIFQRSEAGPTTCKGYLRFVTQMCELANDYLTALALGQNPSN
jgi:hypothetical protein